MLPKAHTLIDLFDRSTIANDGNPWLTFGSPSIVNGRLRFTLIGDSPGYSGVYAINGGSYYDMTDSYLQVEVVSAGNQAWGSLEVDLQVMANGSSDNRVFFTINNGSLIAFKHVAGVSTWITNVAYNSTSHRWLRIRESGGTTYWEYASAEQYLNDDWQVLHSEPNPINMSAVMLQLDSGIWNTESGSTNVEFDNLNVPSGAIGAIKVRSSGTFAAVAVKAKLGGNFVEVMPKLRAGGGF